MEFPKFLVPGGGGRSPTQELLRGSGGKGGAPRVGPPTGGPQLPPWGGMRQQGWLGARTNGSKRKLRGPGSVAGEATADPARARRALAPPAGSGGPAPRRPARPTLAAPPLAPPAFGGTGPRLQSCAAASAMAAQRLEDVLTCSICLGLYVEPVTLSCGHNFCGACIGDWGRGCDKACPECRKPFPDGNELRRNVALSAVLEAMRAGPGPDSAPAPGSALGARCPRHGRPLDLFCRTEARCICSACTVNECLLHERALLDDERREREVIPGSPALSLGARAGAGSFSRRRLWDVCVCSRIKGENRCLE